MSGGYKTAARSKARSRSRFNTYTPSVRVVNKESGFVDTAVTSYNMNTTGSIALLNTVPQNASTNGRVGKKIMLKSLQVRGNVYNNTTATFNDCSVIIVYDKRPQTTLPAITDILNSATSRSFNNDQNSGRFRILKRLDFVLIGNATSLTEATTKDADFFLSLRNLETVYKAAGTGAIGDQEQGSLLVVTVGNNVAGNTAAVAQLGFRLRYVDI